MKAEELEKELFEEVEKYIDIQKGNFIYESCSNEKLEINIKDSEHGASYSINLFKNEEDKIKFISAIRTHIRVLFAELYDRSKSENYFWQYCSFRTYMNLFESRKNSFLDKFDDKKLTEVDFFKSEINNLISLKNNQINQLLDDETKKSLNIEIEKKIKFVDAKDKTTLKNNSNEKNWIFSSELARQLFERYFENFIKSKNQNFSEVSYIYRKMHSEKLIHDAIRPEMFKNFISKHPYSVEINSSLKSFDNCKSPERESNYQIIYELVFKK